MLKGPIRLFDQYHLKLFRFHLLYFLLKPKSSLQESKTQPILFYKGATSQEN